MRLFLLLPVLLAGCTSLNTQSAPDGDLSWLIRSLQDEGVFILERPHGGSVAPATSSVRLILNGQESLEVYEFDRLEEAETTARQWSYQLTGKDVYLREQLVVVRNSRRDTGLSGTLHKLLGSTI
ncbi:MAG: hypothetical protein ACI80V_000598 [Rhodothermales bacterium]|jgi:hypothetical protein